MSRRTTRRPKRSKPSKHGKRKKHSGYGSAQQQPDPPRKPRLRRKVIAVLLVLGAAAAVYAFDRGGPQETIAAQVVETRVYPHTPQGGEAHTHTDVVVEYDGKRRTIKKADTLTKGDWVEIDVRRGRLSGWPHYQSYREAGDFDPLEAVGDTPEPWEYDLVTNRHWDPDHGHWHDGPPPG